MRDVYVIGIGQTMFGKMPQYTPSVESLLVGIEEQAVQTEPAEN